MPKGPILPPHQFAAQQLGAIHESSPPSWFGTYVPNFSEWALGDIVLAGAQGFWGGVIQVGQTISLQRAMRAGSAWSHAAIYVGNGDVVEATQGNLVQLRSVWNYCQTRPLMVCRLNDPSIPASDVADIASEAISHVNRLSYKTIEIVMAKFGWPWSQTPNPNRLYCSTFVGMCVANATQAALWGPGFEPLFPGTLASHPGLADVPLEWRNF